MDIEKLSSFLKDINYYLTSPTFIKLEKKYHEIKHYQIQKNILVGLGLAYNAYCENESDKKKSLDFNMFKKFNVNLEAVIKAEQALNNFRAEKKNASADNVIKKHYVSERNIAVENYRIFLIEHAKQIKEKLKHGWDFKNDSSKNLIKKVYLIYQCYVNDELRHYLIDPSKKERKATIELINKKFEKLKEALNLEKESLIMENKEIEIKLVTQDEKFGSARKTSIEKINNKLLATMPIEQSLEDPEFKQTSQKHHVNIKDLQEKRKENKEKIELCEKTLESLVKMIERFQSAQTGSKEDFKQEVAHLGEVLKNATLYGFIKNETSSFLDEIKESNFTIKNNANLLLARLRILDSSPDIESKINCIQEDLVALQHFELDTLMELKLPTKEERAAYQKLIKQFDMHSKEVDQWLHKHSSKNIEFETKKSFIKTSTVLKLSEKKPTKGNYEKIFFESMSFYSPSNITKEPLTKKEEAHVKGRHRRGTQG
jgi:hypothetical protein